MLHTCICSTILIAKLQVEAILKIMTSGNRHSRKIVAMSIWLRRKSENLCQRAVAFA